MRDRAELANVAARREARAKGEVCNMNDPMQCCVSKRLVTAGEEVIQLLRQADKSVVTAESCTGGLVAACLTHGRNASACFHGAFVVYSKSQKSHALGVDRELLRLRGAVNSEVAIQMAEGALKRSVASIALSITGVLGPDPDEDQNPPGLVFLGLAQAGRPTVANRLSLPHCEPDKVREQTVLRAFELLTRALHDATPG
jgi:nicotinamide-nucleotide amidase